jgi:hypothetical protein
MAYSMLAVIYCMLVYICSQVDTFLRLDKCAPQLVTYFHAVNPLLYYFTQFEVHFAHGFIDILFSSIPPSTSSYVHLPEQSLYTTHREVYVLIMTKPHCKPQLYCGSATGPKGIQRRWEAYDTLRTAQLPKHVRAHL